MIHILTACTRPKNLCRIGDSIFQQLPIPGVTVEWHVRWDPEPHVGGQEVKNAMLREFLSGWVCFLDDDTLMHPGYLKAMVRESQGYDAVLCAQVRNANPHNPELTIGVIDIGQAFIKRRLVGSCRIPAVYDGDGRFLTSVLAGANVRYLREPLSFYNLLGKE